MKTNDTAMGSLLENHLSRLIAVGLLFLLLLLAVTGCRTETNKAENLDPVGNYTLAKVDGQTVPCQLQHESVTMTIKSGTFTINADGTCVSVMNFAVAGQHAARREVNATYAQAGAKLTMRWKEAGTTLGELQGDTFTLHNEGMVLEYVRSH